MRGHEATKGPIAMSYGIDELTTVIKHDKPINQTFSLY